MASTFDDTVLDFDLNLLHQPSTVVNDCRYDKQRKAILIAKKKTIATDSLIRKYYAKNEKLEQTEVLLLAAKEECKQVCIDYKETLEKCTQLEKDAVTLKTRSKELEDSNILLQNQCEAIKSHANQLQVLVNEHETTIDGLKIEKQLNKNGNREYESKLTHLQKDNESLLKHLCLVRDIAFGKKKLKKRHKLLLKKYDKFNYTSDGEESSEESSEEHFCDSLPPSPVSVNDTENKKEVAFNVSRNSNLIKKVIDDHESDCSNEVVSEDTGRGSSLAFSDGEKCFNSPDYFQNDSPLAADATKVKDKKTFADIGTNPIHQELVHVATSPIMFDHPQCQNIILKIDKAVQVQIESRKIQVISDVIIKEKTKLVDSATSPIPIVFELDSPVVCKEDNHTPSKTLRASSHEKQVIVNSDKDIITQDHSKEYSERPENIINTIPPDTEVPQAINSSSCKKSESDQSNISDVSMIEVPEVIVSNNDRGIRNTIPPDTEVPQAVNSSSCKESESEQSNISDVSMIEVPEVIVSNNDRGIRNTIPPDTEVPQAVNSSSCKESESDQSNISDVSMIEVAEVIVSNNDRGIRKISLSETIRENAENAVNISEPKQINIQEFSSQSEIEFSGKPSSVEEKKCLERNNSNNVCQETVNDSEIEMILNTMRLTERLITPLPKTPVILTKKKSRQLFSPIPETSEPLNNHTACVEALKLREENKSLKTSISDLSQEIMKIKRILKDQMLMPESPKKQGNAKKTTKDFDLLEDSSQETLVVSVNNDANSTEDLSEDLPLSEYICKLTSPPKETKKRHNTAVRMSPRKHSSTDNNNAHILREETNESKKKFDCHTPRKTSRKNSHEEHVIVNNDKETIAQDNSKEFSDTDMVDEEKRKRKVGGSKLSRLERFRKKLIPKGKIARIKAPIKKLRTKPKSKTASSTNLGNINNLNNQSAYEKAVNVMKELKLKEINKEHHIRKLKKQNKCEPEKKDCNEAVNINRDIVKNVLHSPIKELSVKISPYSPNKNDLYNIAECSSNKEDLTKTVQCSPNKELLVKIAQMSPNKGDLIEIAQLSSNNNDLIKDTHSSPSKDGCGKITHCSPNKIDSVKVTHGSPNKSDSVKDTHCSPNKKESVKITPFSPKKDYVSVVQHSPIENNSIKVALFSTNKEGLTNSVQYSPNKNKSVKITPFSPNKDDSINIAQLSPSRNNTAKVAQCSPSKEDSPDNAKRPVVCLSQLKLDVIVNKNDQINDERNSETGPGLLRIVNSSPPVGTKNYITTRSRSKMSDQESISSSRKSSTESMTKCTEEVEGNPPRKRLRADSDGSEVTSKRVLRSSNMRDMVNEHSQPQNITCNNSPETVIKMPQKRKSTEGENSPKISPRRDLSKMFTNSNEPFSQYDINTEISDACFNDMLTTDEPPVNHPKQSILCKMIDKYGKTNVRFNAKKVPDSVSNSICKKLEDNIAHIIEMPAEKVKPAMAKLVEDIQHNWNLKNFLSGFLKYLKDPARKAELFNKITSPPAPAMTKSEQVILYIVKQLAATVPDIVNIILTQIEFSLFQLNKSPEFGVIESLSHVYALICRYFGLKMRLRLFILDAMYCLSFKVVPLIKQCLDVWMHILPLAHMGIAKSPLVTCLVYLLHFYKCEDRYNRVQDIRMILNKKYFYQITDWNEPKILELFRTSIIEIRDISVEKKMLRMALIILAKRQGPNWCQKNIIKKMLMPLIEKENIPLRVKQFSIEMLGPLLKPYPVDMKVHCEIVVNNLLDMLDSNPADSLKEAIFTSLIYMSKHNQNRVLQALLSWKPEQITPEFEKLLKDYVQEKNLKVWKGLLSRITF